MSKYDELLKELCPNGVKYRKISEVCDISRGQVMSKDYISQNTGEYPVYSSQTENNGELGKINTYMYDGEFLTWTTDGANAGTVFFRQGKFSITNVCGLLRVNTEDLLIKFLYYTLSIEAPKYVGRGMGNPKLMSNVMGRIKIPVPPIEVQREIVKILDNFTELTARKKQYEYYRLELFNGIKEHSKATLISLADIKRGVRVIKKELDSDGKYPVFQNSLTPMGYYNDYNCDAETTYVISAGAAGEIGYCRSKFWAADDCLVFRNLKGVINRYIYHYLMTKSTYIRSNVRKASIPRLSRTVIENIEIPVPPIEEQERIVSILDRFDSICNDISAGLPAEIEARQKQYEYYRDKLLNFKEMSV